MKYSFIALALLFALPNFAHAQFWTNKEQVKASAEKITMLAQDLQTLAKGERHQRLEVEAQGLLQQAKYFQNFVNGNNNFEQVKYAYGAYQSYVNDIIQRYNRGEDRLSPNVQAAFIKVLFANSALNYHMFQGKVPDDNWEEGGRHHRRQ